MENEYNLVKIQEEADKLHEKVKFGDTPNYGEAEKLVKQERSEVKKALSNLAKEYLGTRKDPSQDINFKKLVETVNEAYTKSVERLEISTILVPYLQYGLANRILNRRFDQTEYIADKNPTEHEQFFRLLELIDIDSSFFDYKVLNQKGTLVDESDRIREKVSELAGRILKNGIGRHMPIFSNNPYLHWNEEQKAYVENIADEKGIIQPNDISSGAASVIALFGKLHAIGWQPQDIILEKGRYGSKGWSLIDDLTLSWKRFHRGDDYFDNRISFLRKVVSYQVQIAHAAGINFSPKWGDDLTWHDRDDHTIFFIGHGIQIEKITKTSDWQEVDDQKNLKGLSRLVEEAMLVEVYNLDNNFLCVRHSHGKQEQDRILDIRAIVQDATDALIQRHSSIEERQKGKQILTLLEESSLSYGIGERVFQKHIQPRIQNGIENYLAEGKIVDLNNFLKELDYSEEQLFTSDFVKSSDTQKAAEKGIVNLLIQGDKSGMEWIKEKFLPQLDMTKFVTDKFLSYIDSKEWGMVLKMDQHFPECQPTFHEFLIKQKEIAKNNELSFAERRKAFNILAGLAKNGEASVGQEFSEIISARVKQKEIADSKWGLDPLQEGAFYTLMQLDNSDSNRALFSLVFNENINSTIKYAVLKKLLRNESGFLNSQLKENLHAWLYFTSPKQADWHDMEFVGEIQKIPSKELRDKSLKSLSILKGFDLSTFPLYKTWSEKYSNIPQNVFLQVLELDWACESEGLLDKFQNLFSSIHKEGSKKDSLLYGITNVLETDHQTLKLLGEKLATIDFGSKQDADSLSELLRRIVFLNRIEKIKSYQSDDDRYDRDEDYEEQPREKQLPPEISEIFSKEAKNLNELVSLVKEVTTRKFQEILPNENITAEKIEAIEKEWGDLEPIFTYLGRFPSLKEYVAEIVANIDTVEGWKNWRYDLKNEGVKNQIGHLSEEQFEIWKGDYFSEIGDIMVAETGSDKPKQIQHILQEAVLQHRHIFNPEMRQNKNEFISKTLEAMFAEMTKTPDKQSEIIDNEIKNISSDARSIDAIINFNNLPRVRQGIELILSASAEITPSSKIKNTVGFISAYLPAELRKVLESNYSRLEDQKKMAVDELFTPEMRQAVEQKAREIEEGYQNAFNSDIWEKCQLDKNNAKNLEQFYQKRQELKSAIDLLRLLDLSNKLIATNRIAEKEGKKGGETITSVLERLKKYFKDSPLVQDINNVEFILKEKIDFGEKRRLAMIFTDNVQMLWQAGKYPLGNGSCQHYAEGSYASQLMGYVGDPNCKVAYLVDLNRLPQGVRSEIEEKGFEETKDKISKQDLLNASLARSIIKMTRDGKSEPVILLEPTYTVVYKGDATMDRYFNLFVDLMIAEPIKAKIARGGGNGSVIKGQSLSPGGQYEDLDLNGVKFIHKLSKPTKEEMEVMERIRSSR